MDAEHVRWYMHWDFLTAIRLTNHFYKAHDVWVAQAAQHCDFMLCLALLLPASGHRFHFMGHC